MIKQKITETPILALFDFDNVFKVNCDASDIDISGVLSQSGRLVTFSVRNYPVPKKLFYLKHRILCHTTTLEVLASLPNKRSSFYLLITRP